MRPTTARSSRSSLHHPRSSPIPTPSTTSSVYQQQPQQQILYAPISKPMVTLQPCGTALHPSCVYPTVQPHVESSNSAPIHLPGKNNQWHTKNKSSHGQQHYQQQHLYPKMMLLDQHPAKVPSAIPPSTTSFLVASSTFTHGPMSGEHYNNTSGVTHLLPQPYFKPPDVQQTFCLIQDRQNAQQQQQHPIQASYYNISATNACSLQTVNTSSSFPLASISPYSSLATFTNNQFPTSVQPSPLFSSSPVGLVFASSRDKSLPLPTLEFPSLKHSASKTPSVCESRLIPIGANETTSDWPSQVEISKNSYDLQTENNSKNLNSLQKTISSVTKTDEEHYSDASSTSFDFTIEAEKMVSALCNTTSSNDLNKEESKTTKIDSTPLFSGAGDNVSNKTAWFTDFCSEYENRTSVGVQTGGLCVDSSQYPELIRKTAYWGCTEAEIVLGCDNMQTDPKRDWLTCLSSATKTAITKSSTCIPVFAGDRVFADDLINALLRISNGWLSLDNYLNKQHFPNLLDRLDPEFITCFHAWEENTHELLKQIVQTFEKFSENNEASSDIEKCKEIRSSSSFPGDVSLYTNYDLFAPLPVTSLLQQNAAEKAPSQEASYNATITPLSSSLLSFQYNSGQQEHHSACNKESKLRSKWTITENLSPVINTTKSVPNISACHANSASGLMSNKFRAKDTSSSKRFDFTQTSLNAEFCQLRNKVMESNADVTKDRRQDYMSETKLSAFTNNTESIRLQNPMTSNSISYRRLYAQNCMSFIFPVPGQSDSSYLASNPRVLTCTGANYPLQNPYSIIDSRSGKNPEQLCGIKNATANPVYVGKSQVDQIGLPAVPRNKVTLLSQIEPRTLDKESKEMAANLSAWFASMRNAQLPTAVSAFEQTKMNENATQRLFAKQEPSKYSSIVYKQSQLDANRQFQALQNLPNIQSTPWAAGSFISGRPRQQHVPEEYDSSEDVRVYMKPGSYNVPKKRHQRRPNRRSDNNVTSRNVHTSNHRNVCSNKSKSVSIPASSTPLSHLSTLTLPVNNTTLIRSSFPSASQLPAPLFNLENSPRILKRTEFLSQDAHRDVTWKAACASAEILLEALNVKDCANTSKKIDRDSSTEKDDKNEDNADVLPLTSQQRDPKLTKRSDVDCASSYEASEDDSGSTCRLSASTSVMSVPQSCDNENTCSIALSAKTNVKTDSWLIRTLNNASIGKQKQRKDSADRGSSESSSSSVIANVKSNQGASLSTADTDSKIPATIIDDEYPAIFSREHIPHSSSINDETSAKESEGLVGRATYSETVRRSIRSDNAHLSRKESYKASNASVACGTMIPIPGRKCQRKDPEQSYQLLHKSQRSTDKKSVENVDSSDIQLEEGSCAKFGNAKSKNATSTSSSTIKTFGKKKDLEHSGGSSKCANKSGDRGWSVWYSSRRKQSLSPLALSKLEMIYQIVWKMDEAKIFKYPISCGNKDGQLAAAGMDNFQIKDNYCKTVKSPMFLEIIDYKLKNRIYHKVEYAVKDFRHIIQNARSYNQHDDERTRKIEVFSKKLEDLFEEHFSNWDLGNIITGSPREDATVQVRCKTSGQKLMTGRCDNMKKSTTSLSIAEENISLH
ncbi:uncharacterized protein LOC116840263 [Odontomachus brunneus]|uniref:uncharacterized protein LOC116840263 n=1 Tax=Odontomachus brunneus TaxID=486640 RepID=UPI0013F2518E|nr:uncharacterized protein LOC116840263 [Odontomachus brunneus]